MILDDTGMITERHRASMDELKWLEDNCFLDTEIEKDYHDKEPASDMWSKLDLLTPPLSPQHESDMTIQPDLDMDRLIDTCLFDMQSGGGKSHECSDVVGNDRCRCSFTCRLKDLRSNLVQDCMWSGTGPLSNAINTQVSMAKNKASVQTDTPELRVVKTADITNNVDNNMEAVSPQCVDPTAVFSSAAGPLVHNNSYCNGPATPSESGEDDDVDIETIDTEPTAKAHITMPSYRSVLSRALTTVKQEVIEEDTTHPIVTSPLAHVTSMHNYSSTQPNPGVMTSVNQLTNGVTNYATKRARTNDYRQGDAKKGRYVRNAWGSSSGRQYGPYSKSKHLNGSRSNSDNEDSPSEGSKRAQHNVLERKRRNDLKSSFSKLRGEIPELQSQERAAKVVILKKSADYIHSLQRTEKHLVGEVNALKKKQERLKRYLNSLQGDHYEHC